MAGSASTLQSIRNSVWQAYQSVPQQLKLIDAYLFYILLTGVAQFVYCAIVGTYPFNAFLAGFISTVGAFVLGVGLRLQCNRQNFSTKKEEKSKFAISPERAFADFLFCNIVLQLVVFNFLG